jgi:hypothetical protein
MCAAIEGSIEPIDRERRLEMPTGVLRCEQYPVTAWGPLSFDDTNIHSATKHVGYIKDNGRG